MRITQRQRLEQLVQQALDRSPYEKNSKQHWIYCTGLLQTLLCYSAQHQPEVWQHLERRAQELERDSAEN